MTVSFSEIQIGDMIDVWEFDKNEDSQFIASGKVIAKNESQAGRTVVIQTQPGDDGTTESYTPGLYQFTRG